MSQRKCNKLRSLITVGLTMFAVFEGAHAEPHPHHCPKGYAYQQMELTLQCEDDQCTKHI